MATTQLELESETDRQLKELFNACDTDGSGFIGVDEVREICMRFGASEDDALEIFQKLDRDKDGKVSFEDFRAGFDDYEKGVIVSTSPCLSPAPITRERGLSSESSFKLPETPAVSPKPRSSRKRKTSVQVTLNGREIEGDILVQELIEKINHLKDDNSRLSASLVKDRKELECHIQELEVEMDSQVKQVELRVKKKAEEEFEAERKSLRQQLKEELEELHQHMEMFQKVDSWLKANQEKENKDDKKMNEYRQKLEEAIQENRQMRHSLLDTQTMISTMRGDLSNVRAQYEDKCQELEKEREKVILYLQEQELLSKQITVLQ